MAKKNGSKVIWIIILILLFLYLNPDFFGSVGLIGDDYQYFDDFPASINWIDKGNGIYESSDGLYTITLNGFPKPTVNNGYLCFSMSGGGADYPSFNFKINQKFNGMFVKLSGYYNDDPRSRANLNYISLPNTERSQQSFVYEIIPSILNPNQFEVFFNGRTYGLKESNNVEVGFSGTKGAGGNYDNIGLTFCLDYIKYKPQFNCEIPSGYGWEIYKADSGKTISHLTIQAEKQVNHIKYCTSIEPIRIKENYGADQNSYEILYALASGKALTIPSDQTWLIFMITDKGTFTYTEALKEALKCLEVGAGYDGVQGKCVIPEPIPEPPLDISKKPIYDKDLNTINEFTFEWDSVNNQRMKVGNALFIPYLDCESKLVSFNNQVYEFSENTWDNSLYPFSIYYTKKSWITKGINTAEGGKVWCRKTYKLKFTDDNFLTLNFDETTKDRYLGNETKGNLLVNNKFVRLNGYILNKYSYETLFSESIEKIPIELYSGKQQFILHNDKLGNLNYETRLGFEIETTDSRFNVVTKPVLYTYNVLPNPLIGYLLGELTLREQDIILLQASLQEKAILINKLNLSIDRQIKIVEAMELNLAEKIILIQDLTTNINEQAEMVDTLNLTLQEKTAMVKGLTQNLNEQIQIVSNLELRLNEKMIMIESLSSNLNEQAQFISSLELSIAEQAQAISYLTSVQSQQAQIINNLNLKISDQAQLIHDLTSQADRQGMIISNLNLKIEEQLSIITSLTSEIDEQAIMINQLNINLQQKAEAIGKLTATNEEQAQMINAMRLSFAEQASIINVLDLTIQDDAVLISNLELSLSEQRILTNNLQLTQIEKDNLIAELQDELLKSVNTIKSLNLNLAEQGSYIANLELTNQQKAQIIQELTTNINEQATLISSLNLKISDQAEIINGLGLTIAQEGGLINSLNLKISDEAELITSLRLTISEDVELINNLNLKIEEEAEIINSLNLNIDELVEMINHLNLTTQEQLDLISKLKLNIAEQKEIIERLGTKIPSEIPSWIWFAVGGFILLLIIFRKKS